MSWGLVIISLWFWNAELAEPFVVWIIISPSVVTTASILFLSLIYSFFLPFFLTSIFSCFIMYMLPLVKEAIVDSLVAFPKAGFTADDYWIVFYLSALLKVFSNIRYNNSSARVSHVVWVCKRVYLEPWYLLLPLYNIATYTYVLVAAPVVLVQFVFMCVLFSFIT